MTELECADFDDTHVDVTIKHVYESMTRLLNQDDLYYFSYFTLT